MIVKNFAVDHHFLHRCLRDSDLFGCGLFLSVVWYKTEIALAGFPLFPARAVPGVDLVISQIV